MSLVRAFRIKVEEEVEKAGGDGSRLTAEALKNAVLSAKLDLSVGQVRGKVHFLSASCSALTKYQAYTLGLFLLPQTMPLTFMASCTIALYPQKPIQKLIKCAQNMYECAPPDRPHQPAALTTRTHRPISPRHARRACHCCVSLPGGHAPIACPAVCHVARHYGAQIRIVGECIGWGIE